MVWYTEQIYSFFPSDQKIYHFLEKDLVTKYFLVGFAFCSILGQRLFM